MELEEASEGGKLEAMICTFPKTKEIRVTLMYNR